MDTKIIKLIFILIFVCLYNPFLKGVNQDSLVIVKGYYITRFDKIEIENSYYQKINKLREKSYTTNIDYTSISFFIPLQIDGDIVFDKNTICQYIEVFSNLNKDTVFYIPTTKYFEKYINRIFNQNMDLSKEICLLQDVGYSYPFYFSENTNNYLYKCVYLEGEALRKYLPNTEDNRFMIDLDIDAVNKRALNINVFFLINITNYTPFINIKGLKQWYPYL